MARVNLGTARIVIIVALVVAGVAVLANGFSSGAVLTPPGGAGGTTAPGAIGPDSSSPTTSATKPPRVIPSPVIQGVLIAVFNGTNSTGLAGQVQQLLMADGYVAAQDPADVNPKPVAKTVVYFRGGASALQNRSEAQHVSDTYFHGARVTLLSSSVASTIDPTAQVVIIVGVDYANATTAGG
jgi:hypothetical protein